MEWNVFGECRCSLFLSLKIAKKRMKMMVEDVCGERVRKRDAATR